MMIMMLSLQPMLELLAALATDLQQEFSPHLKPFLNILMSGPFTIRDASVIKWSVKCLGHLLKTLWRPISGQLEEVYRLCEALFRQGKHLAENRFCTPVLYCNVLIKGISSLHCALSYKGDI